MLESGMKLQLYKGDPMHQYTAEENGHIGCKEIQYSSSQILETLLNEAFPSLSPGSSHL